MRYAMQVACPPPAAAEPVRTLTLAPMLSGARARGFADGLEWLGFAAVLFDDHGEALHLNAGAIESMGDDLYLEAGRLRAADSVLDASITAAIAETLTTGATRELRVGGRRAMTMRIVAVEPAGDDPCQVMRAVALFLPRGGA